MNKPLSLAVAATIAASLVGAVLFLARLSPTFLQPAIAFASDPVRWHGLRRLASERDARGSFRRRRAHVHGETVRV